MNNYRDIINELGKKKELTPEENRLLAKALLTEELRNDVLEYPEEVDDEI